uniref:Thymidylate synthase/dCMP hydroxymethylase domain-containing protein n=1 Tax=candidate division CPR3 bacterium TaxID=2268181 RepID=A0A7C4R7W0_UNCC3
MGKGSIPVISVSGNSISEAWQKAFLEVYEKGVRVATPKHQEGVTPLGWDAAVLVEVTDPLSQPRFHKAAVPGLFDDLEIYRLEVIYGIHNFWVGDGWDYTYHERIFEYKTKDGTIINQITNMIAQIKQNFVEKGRVSGRDFQVTSWMPWNDPFVDDPPCFQRAHFRLLKNEEGEGFLLDMGTDWRSRDLFKAWLMNVFAFTDLQRIIAKRVSEALGVPVTPGKYIDYSNSLHLYGAYADGINGAVRMINARSFEDLTTDTSADEMCEEMTIEARRLTAARLDAFKKGTVGKGASKETLKDLGYDIKNFPYPPEWDE